MEEIKKETEGAAESAPKKEKKKSEADTLRAEIEELKAELEKQKKELDDKYLRMAAEYDNFRRRSREEREATYEIALSDTVAEILPIIDNLERAAAIEADGPLKDGIVMIMKSVDSQLAKLGVESVGKVGDTFDPNLHNAVFHVEDDSFGENEIVEVLMKGYTKGDKVIRYAMVKVAN